MEQTISKEPSVCFKVEKIIGVSVGTGNVHTYQVQWAPVWVSGLHLVGCEHLIEEFLDGTNVSVGYDNRSKTSNAELRSDIIDVHYIPHTTAPTKEDPRTPNSDGQCHSLIGKCEDDWLESSDDISQSSTVIPCDTQETRDEEDPVIVIPVEVTKDEHTESRGHEGVDLNFQYIKEPGNSGDDNYNTLFPHVNTTAKDSSSVSTSEGTQQLFSTDQSTMQSKMNNINSIGAKLSLQKKCLFENSEYDCHECHKKFTYKSSLRKHLQLHKSQHPHYCEICKQMFKSKTDLKIHSTLHTGEIPLQCSYCNKVFSQKHYLMVHERQHMGDNPHKCSECDKIFTSRANLEKHFRLHTGEKPYECPACSKRFTQKGNLRSHFVRIHKMLKLDEYNLEEI